MKLIGALGITCFITIPLYSQTEKAKPAPQAQEGNVPAFFSARSTPLSLPVDTQKESRNCESTVDLRDEFMRRNLPDRRHQDTTGWCYAFVGADLVSYELGQNISPADIARQYLNHSPPAHLQSLEAIRTNPVAQFQPLGGGFTRDAVEITRDQGFCRESEFPSEDYSWSEEQQLALIQQYPNKNERPSVCLDVENIVPLYTNIPIEDLLSVVTSDEFKRILNRLPHSRCLERLPLSEELSINTIVKKGRSSFDDSANDSFYDQIDNVLTGNRPVSLAINNSIFGRPVESFRSLSSAGHQVILAGRRFNQESGMCEYLIRNSESGCQNYHTEYECENNHVWIPREIVRMGTFSADYFTGPGRNQLRND